MYLILLGNFFPDIRDLFEIIKDKGFNWMKVREALVERKSIESARKQFISIVWEIYRKHFLSTLELMIQSFNEELVPKLLLNTELPKAMDKTIAQMIFSSVIPFRKSEPVVTPIPVVNGLCPEWGSLSKLLETVYERERQTDEIYFKKLHLRQKIYLLLSEKMTEMIDLFLIGSSLNQMGSNSSDVDLCLIIYGKEGKLDPKYEIREEVLLKLQELSKIFENNGFSSKAEVIPALVPILKFIEMSSGIEINININRVVTIRNTHLLNTYSRLDKRVAQLILTVKLWAKRNGINSAYNKSLTSYSISLMAIHFLQSVCCPPVVPCLQQTYPHLFVEDVTQLRLNTELTLNFKSINRQNLGELFTKFFQYYCLEFDYDKVISVRMGRLLDKETLLAQRFDINGRVWQWKCHICIEEPFIGTNTSHAVHDCRMFREILQKIVDTYRKLVNGCFTL